MAVDVLEGRGADVAIAAVLEASAIVEDSTEDSAAVEVAIAVEPASVTGQMVVLTAITDVTTTVECAGQFVTVSAQLVTVIVVVLKMVLVVRGTEVWDSGKTSEVEVATAGMLRFPVLAAVEMTTVD